MSKHVVTGFYNSNIGNVLIDTRISDTEPSPCSDLNITIDLSDAQQRDILLTWLDKLRASIISEARQGSRYCRITFKPYTGPNKKDVILPAGPFNIVVTIDASSIEGPPGEKCAAAIRARLTTTGWPFDQIVSDAG